MTVGKASNFTSDFRFIETFRIETAIKLLVSCVICVTGNSVNRKKLSGFLVKLSVDTLPYHAIVGVVSLA